MSENELYKIRYYKRKNKKRWCRDALKLFSQKYLDKIVYYHGNMFENVN